MQMSFVFWSFKFMICLGFSVLYLFWAITSSAIAQGQAGTDIAILNAGVGARALGMGSAFTTPPAPQARAGPPGPGEGTPLPGTGGTPRPPSRAPAGGAGVFGFPP